METTEHRYGATVTDTDTPGYYRVTVRRNDGIIACVTVIPAKDRDEATVHAYGILSRFNLGG